MLEDAKKSATCGGLKPGEGIPFGMQHDYLVSMLGRLRRWGLSEAEMLALAQQFAHDRFEVAMSEEEIIERVRSVAKYAPGTWTIHDEVNEHLRRKGLTE